MNRITKALLIPVLMLVACGGGNPMERELDLVQKDLLDEKVSVPEAGKYYGVMADSDSLQIAHKSTLELRQISDTLIEPN